MTDREKLIEIMAKGCQKSSEENGVPCCTESFCKDNQKHCYGAVADHLLANGVVVREKGEWRNNKDDYPECDKCGYMPQYDPMIDDIYYSDFCPNCGADMRKGENG